MWPEVYPECRPSRQERVHAAHRMTVDRCSEHGGMAARPPSDPLERLEATARRRRQPPEQADADDRQPVRDDGLRSAEEPRRVRAARQLSTSTRSTPRPATTPPSSAARPRSEGYDVVVAFGGDGTVNEAANGLAGSETPLTCLPGGRANVYCRMLGIPTDVVDATEHLLRIADDWRPRRVDLGAGQRPLLHVLGRASGSTPASSSASTPTRD